MPWKSGSGEPTMDVTQAYQTVEAKLTQAVAQTPPVTPTHTATKPATPTATLAVTATISQPTSPPAPLSRYTERACDDSLRQCPSDASSRFLPGSREDRWGWFSILHRPSLNCGQERPDWGRMNRERADHSIRTIEFRCRHGREPDSRRTILPEPRLRSGISAERDAMDPQFHNRHRIPLKKGRLSYQEKIYPAYQHV